MSENEYFIGQQFEGIYPPEAAIWCNNNNAHLDANDKGYIIIENHTIEPAVEEQINILQQYLNDTDYKVIKFIEAGEPIPEDIKAKRTETRKKINELQQTTP